MAKANENTTPAAETQNTTPAVEAQDTAPAVEKTEPEMVTIKIPRTKKDEPDVFVGVNHRTYMIKRGKPVQVPAFVAEVLRHQEEMFELIMDFEEANADKNE